MAKIKKGKKEKALKAKISPILKVDTSKTTVKTVTSKLLLKTNNNNSLTLFEPQTKIISAAIRGTKGDKGDPGKPGEIGPKGDPGKKGPKGDKGQDAENINREELEQLIVQKAAMFGGSGGGARGIRKPLNAVTDNALIRWDGEDGKQAQDSCVISQDNGLTQIQSTVAAGDPIFEIVDKATGRKLYGFNNTTAGTGENAFTLYDDTGVAVGFFDAVSIINEVFFATTSGWNLSFSASTNQKIRFTSGGTIEFGSGLITVLASTKTIASGAITPNTSRQVVAAETGTSDVLSTMNAGTAGALISLRADVGDQIDIDTAGNIQTGVPLFRLSQTRFSLFQYNETNSKWVLLTFHDYPYDTESNITATSPDIPTMGFSTDTEKLLFFEITAAKWYEVQMTEVVTVPSFYLLENGSDSFLLENGSDKYLLE